MKKILTAFIVVFVILVFSACQNSWKEFQPTDGGFIVLMPGTPTYEKLTSNTVIGPIDTNMYMFSGKKYMYAVGYSDYEDSIISNYSTEYMLNTKRDATIDNLQGKLLSELIIEKDNNPGREWRILSANEKYVFTIHVYIVGHRVYQIEITSAKEDLYSNDIAYFLESFKLIPK
jgi:hypothetical protein